ncbi:MAG: tetratricopeptide repeat protein [Deltaproteobacteria bacterium]|nr:tetratricopeptide repeat protein [Deltaproteobacteria bacterium]
MRSTTTEILLVLGVVCGACSGPRAALHPVGLREQAACATYLTRREVDRAETACTICLKYDAANPECLNNLGLVWYLRGDDDKARELYAAALRSNPDFVQPHNNLGRLALDRRDYARARRHFAAAVELDPAFVNAVYNLALTDLREAQQRYAQAAADCADRERCDDALESLAHAERGYRELLELAPADVRGHADLGVVESFRAEMLPTESQRRAALERAELHYLSCLHLSPDHVECHGNLAQLCLGTGRCREAVAHLRRCLEIDPPNAICQQSLAPAASCARAQEAALGPDPRLPGSAP